MTAVLISMLGGLGLFLYGMKMMSDGIEKAAGDKLRGILQVLTKNKVISTIVGTIFTGIIQSSTAVTVMAVSFVNAGLMSVSQSVGIIFGANIGTTVTSQLVSFNLSAAAPIFVFVGVILFMFGKRPILKKIGEVILGFGILFVGMSTMAGNMSGMKDSPVLTNLLATLSNPVVGILVGAGITAAVQSSSVTVSLIVLMASQGLIELPICLYIILGCNIGAALPAVLVSMSGNANAKRTALIHMLFNIIGTVITAIVLAFAGGPIAAGISGFSANAGRAVANAHTIFKIAQVIVLLPFSGLIVKLTYILVRKKDHETQDEFTLQYIGEHAMHTPASALPQAIGEIHRMGDMAVQNLNDACEALISNRSDLIRKVMDKEKVIDYLSQEITKYLINANQLSLPISDRKMLAGLFHVVNDIERIGDHAVNIAEDAEKKIEGGYTFSTHGEGE
ncbi:MAG: Na/Pi cotransporter family protein, partial [Lachnospiraceae bacterium]|nr:Na/Pi cotransporter family protein [Lachnospiraceae bacterium]